MKKLSVILCALSTAYTIWYIHYDKPWTNDGALSWIGLHHRGAFAVWGILTFAALALGIVLGYRKTLKTKVYLPLLTLSGIGMALTLIFRFDYDIKPDYYFHVGGSLAFSVITGFTVFLLFFLSKEKLLAAITAIVMLGDMLLLIFFKETGLIEVLPIFTGYILLCIHNLRRDSLVTA